MAVVVSELMRIWMTREAKYVSICWLLTFQFLLNLPGIPHVRHIRFHRAAATLTCASNGGPATTVIWTKDGVMISLNATYTQSQVVTNGTSGRYNTVLNITADPAGIVGTYACTVSNFRGSSVTRSISVKGETYFCKHHHSSGPSVLVYMYVPVLALQRLLILSFAK